MATNVVYKIFNPKTGLYSKGGVYHPRWGKVGKVWASLAYLNNHLSQLFDHDPKLAEYTDCVIVCGVLDWSDFKNVHGFVENSMWMKNKLDK